jgi:hypothetical protein
LLKRKLPLILLLARWRVNGMKHDMKKAATARGFIGRLPKGRPDGERSSAALQAVEQLGGFVAHAFHDAVIAEDDVFLHSQGEAVEFVAEFEQSRLEVLQTSLHLIRGVVG